MEKPTLLLVDDTPANLSVLNGILKEDYKLRLATSGSKALELVHLEPLPQLILLDVMMSGMDGYEVCKHLKANPKTATIPILFLTAKTEVHDETIGFDLGAVDYIHKPIIPAIVKARVRTHISLVQAQHLLERHNTRLEEMVQERTHELTQLHDALIIAFGSVAEVRDNETGNHIRRTALYVECLATELAQTLGWPELTPTAIQDLRKAAPLHDIGKVGVPDHILLKPGKLTAEEFEQMKLHTVYGFEILTTVKQTLDTPQPVLDYAMQIALSHQEKWNGSGYPHGLKGEDIPLSARLMALADVYDALISKRCYKPAFSHEQAVAIILEGSGSHFQPEIVKAFARIQHQFAQIAERLRDEPAGHSSTDSSAGN